MKNINNIFSLGDIIDTYLVNLLKIEKIDSQPTQSLQEINVLIEDLIKEMVEKTEELECFKIELKKVLELQWDILDQVMNEDLSRSVRAEYALQAQEINKERVYWKNKINDKYKYRKEIKEYGKRN